MLICAILRCVIVLAFVVVVLHFLYTVCNLLHIVTIRKGSL